MKFSTIKLLIPFLFIFVFGIILTSNETVSAETVLFKASLQNNRKKIVSLRQNGKILIIRFEGFSKSPVEFKATNGRISSCRTIIEHTSDKANIRISLPIPDRRAPCRMLPGFITVKNNSPGISVREETINKISGNDAHVRNITQKIFGSIDHQEQ